MNLVYATPGVFDLGGIARYGRHQIAALRELLGADNVKVLSMLGPDPQGFVESIGVEHAACGTGLREKFDFATTLSRWARPRTLFWAGHLNYAPLIYSHAFAMRGRAVVNIYGLEVWSNESWLRAAALKRCWVVSDCHATLDWALEARMVNRSRSAVIWDPVDVDKFKPGPISQEVAGRYGLVDDGRFRVMFLGRLARGDEYKSPGSLIRAFARARLPANAELCIAGTGDLVPELQLLAHELGIARRVHFLGRVPEETLPDVYRLASLFVLVSRRYHLGGEGVPLTPLEAAACGVPIVVGDEDGSREACVHDEGGFILPARDEAALVRTLEQGAQNRERLRVMGAAAARRIQTHFSYRRFVGEHEKILARLEAFTPARKAS